MLAWEKAAIERDRAIDILVGGDCPQGILLLLDLTMSGKVLKAYFENGFEGLEGQLAIQNTVDSSDKPPLNDFGVRIPLLRSDLSHETGPGSL